MSRRSSMTARRAHRCSHTCGTRRTLRFYLGRPVEELGPGTVATTVCGQSRPVYYVFQDFALEEETVPCLTGQASCAPFPAVRARDDVRVVGAAGLGRRPAPELRGEHAIRTRGSRRARAPRSRAAARCGAGELVPVLGPREHPHRVGGRRVARLYAVVLGRIVGPPRSEHDVAAESESGRRRRRSRQSSPRQFPLSVVWYQSTSPTHVATTTASVAPVRIRPARDIRPTAASMANAGAATTR